jgi:hypothetical protein
VSNFITRAVLAGFITLEETNFINSGDTSVLLAGSKFQKHQNTEKSPA